MRTHRGGTLGARLGAIALIIFAAAWVLLNAGASAVRLHTPIGEWPISVDYDGLVSVAHGCGQEPPRKSADSQPSPPPPQWPKKVDLQHTERDPRIRLVTGTAMPGERATLAFTEPSTSKTIVADTETLCGPDRVTLAVRSVAAVAMIGLAALLLWRTMSMQAFGFFLFALGFVPTPQRTLDAYLHPTATIVQNVLNDVFEGAGLWGLAIFSLGLISTRIESPWLLRVRTAVPWVVMVLAAIVIVLSVRADLLLELQGRATGALLIRSQWFLASAALLAFALLVSTYQLSDENGRARLRWFIVSCVIGVPLYVVAYLADNVSVFPIAIPGYFVGWLYTAIVLVPASVVYAELRHHIMDVGLYVRKGTVYGLLGAGIVAIVQAFATWAEPLLKESAAPVLSAVAIVIAFLFHPLKETLHQLIQKYFARGLTRSLRELRRAERAFADAGSFTELEALMTTSAVAALQLTGAALVGPDRVLAQSGFTGREGDLVRLGSEPRLREEVQTNVGAIRLKRREYAALAAFHDDAQPLVAFAIQEPGLPVYVFFVGPHGDGTDLDVEEVHALEGFVQDVTIAHLVIAVRELRQRLPPESPPPPSSPVPAT